MLTMNSVKILHAVRSAITAIAELLVLCVFYLPRVSLFILYFCVFGVFSFVCFVLSVPV